MYDLPIPRVSENYVSKASKFTGKERDSETGLDYFGARYYGSNMGRWMSPDWSGKPEAVPYSDLSDPQSLNLYGYVRNNPLSRTDPDGHDCFADGSCNFLRNPLSAQHWVANGMSTTVSDLLGLDDVAHASRNMRDAETLRGKIGEGTALVLIVGLNVFTGGEGDAAKAAMAESKTFAEAVQGGAHAGFLRNYLDRSIGEISKGIDSIGKQIAEHEAKIANPEKFVKDWASKSEREQQGLINKWQKDINRQTQQKEILKKLKDVKEHQ
jgi:RHS repeat-associated protein